MKRILLSFLFFIPLLLVAQSEVNHWARLGHGYALNLGGEWEKLMGTAALFEARFARFRFEFPTAKGQRLKTSDRR